MKSFLIFVWNYFPGKLKMTKYKNLSFFRSDVAEKNPVLPGYHAATTDNELPKF
jgi:hypothetical protein